jgi:hypothetical protein
MGFAKTVDSNDTSSAKDTSWKSAGFINFYLPAEDGTRIKLGAVGLKTENDNHKLLMDWIAKDPANVTKLLSMLQVDFQSATPAAKPKLILA